MDEHRITKEYLERLSIGELTRMADAYNIDIPPELERIFIIEELLNYLSEDEETEGEVAVPLQGEIRYIESAPLPKQYNITFIETILRDPLWVFAYWEVKNSEREKYEKDGEFEGYELLVEPLVESYIAGSEKEGLKRPGLRNDNVFTILIGDDDHAWYLGFPPVGGKYRVKLCVLKGEERIVLAVSRPFVLPRLAQSHRCEVQLDPQEAEIYRNPLAVLSGVEDFHILRNEDRAARVKRYCDSQQVG
ncbi:MAG: DUF4912 domain-containing protein [Treponema sp.]|jgi:hypothetical protein|nr:DUF4912 domain-containing protein [Treponema sp.]